MNARPANMPVFYAWRIAAKNGRYSVFVMQATRRLFTISKQHQLHLSCRPVTIDIHVI